jgi:predicted RNA-binding protein YlxR (DUF448 family)
MTAAAFPRQRPRTCVACREESPKGVLIRVVRSPSGAVFLDERGKLPGRGAYLCLRRECLDKAKKTKALARALKTEVPEDLYGQIEECIGSYEEKFSRTGGVEEPRSGALGLTELRLREFRSLLGLSRRAGLVHIGMDSVKSQCEKDTKNTKNAKNVKNANKALLILTAADCSESVRDFVRRQAEEAGSFWIAAPLNSEEISAALGANNVQVIALPVRSGLADRIRALLFENCERPQEGRRASLPEGGVALEQNESV